MPSRKKWRPRRKDRTVHHRSSSLRHRRLLMYVDFYYYSNSSRSLILKFIIDEYYGWELHLIWRFFNLPNSKENLLKKIDRFERMWRGTLVDLFSIYIWINVFRRWIRSRTLVARQLRSVNRTTMLEPDRDRSRLTESTLTVSWPFQSYYYYSTMRDYIWQHIIHTHIFVLNNN